MKKIVLLLVLVSFFSSSIFADVIGKAQTSSSLKLCKESRKGRIAIVDDGIGVDPYQVVCKDTSGEGDWEWVHVFDSSLLNLSQYAALDGADFTGQVTIGLPDGTSFSVSGGSESAMGMSCSNGLCDSTNYFEGTASFSAGVGYITVSGIRYGGATSAPPYTCDGADPVGIYFDTDISEFCFCNNAVWTAVDGSGTCS